MEKADEHRKDDAKGTETSTIKIDFIEMPEGVIQFCAPPKSFAKSKKIPKLMKIPKTKRVSHETRKYQDMDDISKMMQKLHFATSRHKEKSRRRREEEPVIKVTTRPKALFKDSSPCTFVAHQGFWRKAFTPTTKVASENPKLTASVSHSEKYQNICLMNSYELKSFEEVRFEDYLSGWNASTSTSYCEPKFKPVKENFQGSAVIQVITASREYSDCSLEELRMEHYMPSIAWKDRESYCLSASELKKLPVTIGSTASVFMEGAASRRKGVIRYVGRLPKKSTKEIFVGIEFKKEWGVCDGRHGGIRFFRTKDHFAEFIPIDSVLPEYMIAESKPDESVSSTTQPSDEEGNRCSVCWSNPIKIIFVPCGHFCTCEKCSKSVGNCPICRKKITIKQRVYVSGK